MNFNYLIALLITFTVLLSIQANVSIEKIVKDLKTRKRYIFAIGFVSSKYLLFVSGSKDRIDFSNGYRMEFKDEPVKGKIKNVENIVPLSKYSDVEDTDVMFVYSDPSGSFLVTMSINSVKVLDLSSSVFKETEIEPMLSQLCYYNGYLHLSFKQNPFFYNLGFKWEESGNLLKFNFDNNNSAVSAKFCQQEFLGNLCVIEDDQITADQSCKSPPPPHIVSGIVDHSTVYLFTKSNDIYYFSKESFNGKKVPLSKTSRKTVWKHSVHTTTPSSSANNSSSESSNAIIVMIIVPLLVILLSAIGVYCFCWGKNDDKQEVPIKMMVIKEQKGPSFKTNKVSKKSDKLKSKIKSKTKSKTKNKGKSKIKSKSQSKSKNKSKSHAESKHSSKFSSKASKGEKSSAAGSSAAGERKTGKFDSPTSRSKSNKSGNN